MPDAHLVTGAVEAELLKELRRRGIVVWLDRDRHYTEYVDRLVERHDVGEFPYPVVPFRGSYLEVMLALEDVAGGLDPTPVLIHMPGFTEDGMRDTPLLEIYMAGYRHRRALDTAVREAATGHLPPDEIAAFLDSGDLSLAEADAWLAGQIGEGRVGLAGLLDRTSLEVVVRELLVKDTFLGEHYDKKSATDLDVLRAYFERQIGMTPAWLDFVGGGSSASSYHQLRDALARDRKSTRLNSSHYS